MSLSRRTQRDAAARYHGLAEWENCNRGPNQDDETRAVAQHGAETVRNDGEIISFIRQLDVRQCERIVRRARNVVAIETPLAIDGADAAGFDDKDSVGAGPHI